MAANDELRDLKLRDLADRIASELRKARDRQALRDPSRVAAAVALGRVAVHLARCDTGEEARAIVGVIEQQTQGWAQKERDVIDTALNIPEGLAHTLGVRRKKLADSPEWLCTPETITSHENLAFRKLGLTLARAYFDSLDSEAGGPPVVEPGDGAPHPAPGTEELTPEPEAEQANPSGGERSGQSTGAQGDAPLSGATAPRQVASGHQFREGVLAMKQRVAALDIGGSGCRLAWVDVDPSGSHQLQQVHQLGSPGSLSALAAAVTDRLGPVSRLGISAAGFVDSPKGVVAHCRVQPWVEGNVVEVLQRKLGGTVTVVNDGEAHLLAHVAGTTAHPILCFAFGTSVGFGMTDEHGNVSRPRGNYNWELSSLRVPTRSSRPEVWWALGTNGLREAQESMGEHEGIKQFGWRIGGLLADFTALFRPRSIVLTGGIIETHGAVLVRGARSEMNRALPAEIDRPTVVSSPFGRQSALVGAAVAAALSA